MMPLLIGDVGVWVNSFFTFLFCVCWYILFIFIYFLAKLLFDLKIGLDWNPFHFISFHFSSILKCRQGLKYIENKQNIVDFLERLWLLKQYVQKQIKFFLFNYLLLSKILFWKNRKRSRFKTFTKKKEKGLIYFWYIFKRNFSDTTF